jgi:hypothetical protein
MLQCSISGPSPLSRKEEIITMATSASGLRLDTRPGLFEHLKDSLVTFLAGMNDGFRAYKRYRALEASSDTQLRRLGITRSEAARYAMFHEAEPRQ